MSNRDITRLAHKIAAALKLLNHEWHDPGGRGFNAIYVPTAADVALHLHEAIADLMTGMRRESGGIIVERSCEDGSDVRVFVHIGDLGAPDAPRDPPGAAQAPSGTGGAAT